MGQSDISLNEKGKDQAIQCGKYLKENYNFDIIYCSNLKRAKETTQLITKETNYTGLINYDSALAERSFGEYEGQIAKEVFSKLEDRNGVYDIHRAPPKGESDFTFFLRVKGFMDQLISEYKEKKDNALIITHGGTLRFIIGYFVYPATQDYYNFPVNSKNCSITLVNQGISSKERFSIDFVNYYQYLVK